MSDFFCIITGSRLRGTTDSSTCHAATLLPQPPKPAHLRALFAECELQLPGRIASAPHTLGVAGKGAACAMSFGIRVAMNIATKRRKAPRYQGAPGRFQPLAGSMKYANVNVNRPGPMIHARLHRLPIAP